MTRQKFVVYSQIFRLAIIGLSLSLTFVNPVCALLIDHSFSGTFDTDRTSVLYHSNGAIPYNYQITHGTGLNTNNNYLTSSSTLGRSITTQELNGYSVSGTNTTDQTFDSQIWPTAEIHPKELAYGIGQSQPFGNAFSRQMIFTLVPELSTILLLGNGFLGLAWLYRKRRRR